MKSIRIISATLLSISVITLSSMYGCGNATDNGAARESEGSPLAQDDNYEVKIVYDSELAKGVAPYEKGKTDKSPLSVLNFNTNSLTEVEIADLGFYDNQEKTGKETLVWFKNITNDTIPIEALHLPDHRFNAVWEGLNHYIPSLKCGFKISGDSIEQTISDYRIVITYRDKKYPPQAFHINLHPDIIKMRKDMGEIE